MHFRAVRGQDSVLLFKNRLFGPPLSAPLQTWQMHLSRGPALRPLRAPSATDAARPPGATCSTELLGEVLYFGISRD